MFIKFEGGTTQMTYQCGVYELRRGEFKEGPCLEIEMDHGKGMVLCVLPGMWHRAYVMNDKGDTVEKIYAPARQDFVDCNKWHDMHYPPAPRKAPPPPAKT